MADKTMITTELMQIAVMLSELSFRDDIPLDATGALFDAAGRISGVAAAIGAPVPPRKPHDYWAIKENCAAEAAKHPTRTAFQRGAPTAYDYAYRNGWLDGFFGPSGYKTPGYFDDKENCRAEAMKCRSVDAFELVSPVAYQSGVRNGWLSEFFAERPIHQPDYWLDKENCRAEAAKFYGNRFEFSFAVDPACYEVCARNGWDAEFFPRRYSRATYRAYERKFNCWFDWVRR
jgi:hypothetical protein